MTFLDRADAGRRLARALQPERFRSGGAVVLALPRGGVAVAAEIAAALSAPLDLVLVRKIGVPFQPELAMGAVVDGPEPLVVRNDDVMALARVSEAEFQQVCDRERAEIERRRQRYLGDRSPVPVEGRTVIVVDDGIATGATVRAALRAVRRRHPGTLVLAVPVAPPDVIASLAGVADEIVCLEQPHRFGAIGAFYLDFHQLSDEDVVRALASAGPRSGGNIGPRP